MNQDHLHILDRIQNRPSRVNPERLTKEAIREAASRIKWNEAYYHELLAVLFPRLPKVPENKPITIRLVG